MSSPSQRPYYGSGFAGVGFRGIGGHLLREFPRVTEPPPDPPIAAAETLTYGPHLVSLMTAGPDGLRVASCPVCVTPALVPHSAGGWFPIRCTACGTEYHASDGTPPPPPPPPPVPTLASALEKLEKVRVHKPLATPSGPTGDAYVYTTSDGRRYALCPHCRVSDIAIPPVAAPTITLACSGCGRWFNAKLRPDPIKLPPPVVPPAVPPVFPAELARWNLGRWVATGEPERWVAARRGTWGETDFINLIESLRVSGYWPVEVPAVRRVIEQATARYRAKAPPPPPPPPPPRTPSWSFPVPTPGVVDEVHTAPDGSRYVMCPRCAFPIAYPTRPESVMRLKCPECRDRFYLMLRGLPPRPRPSVFGNLVAWTITLLPVSLLVLALVIYLWRGIGRLMGE